MSNIEQFKKLSQQYGELVGEIKKVIIGQDVVVEQVLTSIFSGGHALLIGVPGLAKTLLVNTIAQTLGIEYKRIQFTPDLMPSDIMGTEILNAKREMEFVKGPLFANIVLADEINRTPPKTQAALLEAMQEKSVTSSGVSYKLDNPFFVLATQNPIEQEGTYPLPEAQLDRFMLSILLTYPSKEDEISIVEKTTQDSSYQVSQMISKKEILVYQQLLKQIPVVPNVLKYAVDLTTATRPNTADALDFTNEYIKWGAGTRAAQYLIIGAKTHAALRGKASPDIEDIKAVAVPVLQHRILPNYKAEAQNLTTSDIVNELIRAI